jgi:hypothetical protein
VTPIQQGLIDCELRDNNVQLNRKLELNVRLSMVR